MLELLACNFILFEQILLNYFFYEYSYKFGIFFKFKSYSYFKSILQFNINIDFNFKKNYINISKIKY